MMNSLPYFYRSLKISLWNPGDPSNLKQILGSCLENLLLTHTHLKAGEK